MCFSSHTQTDYLFAEKEIVTTSGGRLRLAYSHVEKPINWIFVPGGPGLGSESLSNLIERSHLPGMVWCFDFPGDGSNRSSSSVQVSLQNWRLSLVEAANTLMPAIMVAHSFGGMMVLSTPHLEESLSGLVLISTSPDSCWQSEFNQFAALNPVPELGHLQDHFKVLPTDDGLKAVAIASASYFFSKEELKEGKEVLEELPYSAQAFLLAQREFHPTFKATWIPHTLPT